jgi:hypothetical protein
LCRFVRDEWPEAECWHDAVRLWVEACTAWLAEDSDAPPHPTLGDDPSYLSGWSRRELPFGDFIALLNEWGRLSKMVPPCPREHRPARHWTNGPPG